MSNDGAVDINTTCLLHPFAGSGTWTATWNNCTYEAYYLAVDVPDDSPSVDITLQMWSYDARAGNYNQHSNIAIAQFWEKVDNVLVCSSQYGPRTIQYGLQAPYQSTWYNLSGCGDGSLQALPLTVIVSTIVPYRVGTTLIVPADYAGIYNVTDPAGNVLSRRYTGEPRFVAFLLNVTTPVGTDREAIFVPRSLFFSSLLYTYLNSTSPPSLVGQLSFAQNATSASKNADDLQAILYGNVTLNDYLALIDDLTLNAAGGTIGRSIVFSINDEVAGNPLFYSLPDGVVRLVGYLPPLTSTSWSYVFCTSSCGPPTPKPWWELVWEGLLIVAAVVSAVILPVNAFLMLAQILAQVGTWLWTNILGPGIAIVKSAVAAAQKAVSQLVDFFIFLIKIMVQNSFGPLLAGLSASASRTRLSIQSAYPSALSHYHQTGSVDRATLQLLVNTLLGSYVWALLGLSAVVVAIGIALYPIAPIGLAIMTVAGAIAGALLFKAIAGVDFALPSKSPSVGLLNPFSGNTAFDIALAYADQVSPNGNTDERKSEAALASIIFGAESSFIGLAAVSAVDPTGTSLALAGVVISAIASILAGGATLPGGSGLGMLALGFAVAGVAASLFAPAEAYGTANSGAVFAGWIAFDFSLGSIAFAALSL